MRIASEYVRCGSRVVYVSTVEIPLLAVFVDTLLSEKHPPFETIVFAVVDGKPELKNGIDVGRYHSQTAALRGHQRMVKKWARENVGKTAPQWTDAVSP